MKQLTNLTKIVCLGLCATMLAGPLFAQAEPEESAPATEEQSSSEDQSSSATEVKKGIEHEALVSIGKGAELGPNDSAESVVVIGGSAKIDGKVHDAVVVIGGDAEINGDVGGEVVAVLGKVRLGSKANVSGDLVSVGGAVSTSEGAHIGGHIEQVDFANFGLPRVEWITAWFTQCLMKLRPLAPQVGWVWIVFGVIFLVYVLIAALFPKPVAACIDELHRRPASTFVLGLLTKLLAPIVFVILAATGLGILVIPFIVAAMFFAAVVGKVAVLEWLGFRLGGQMSKSFDKPLLALLVGGLVLTVLYMIPVIGLLTFAILSVWGLGAAVSASFGGLRRESRVPKGPPPVPPVAAPVPSAAAATAVHPSVPLACAVAPAWNPPISESTPIATAAGAAALPPSAGSIPTMPNQPPILPDVLSYPRATFWERMGAAFLDIVLVSLLSAFVGGLPLGLLVALAYFSGMWAWKSTTIGGIVLGLKVVRFDGQPMSFAVALVRGLAAAFSVVVLFLGFLWIAWDREKQGWHDRIAGTVVLRLPRGTPLLCL